MSPRPDRRARRDRLKFASLRESVAERLWPLPVAAVIVAVILGILIPLIDDRADAGLVAPWGAALFSGGPEAARAVLSAVAGSLIAATTLTFSLTVVALQLASSQASPRVLRMFARDPVVHRTLAVFLGTFAFSLTVLRTVRNAGDDPAAVPRIAITLAFVLTLTSVVMLVLFLAHLARQIRIETVLRDVHEETDATIALVASTDETNRDAQIAMAVPERSDRAAPVPAPRSGFLTASDRERLVSVAVRHDLVIEEARAIGANLVEGTPVAFWWPRDDARQIPDEATIAAEIGRAFSIGYERTPTQDIGFGLRQLADIALRGVSPGVNDPTTAVHALGHTAAVLCDLARLPEQAPVLTGADNVARVIVRTHEFAALLELGVGQVRRYGRGDPDVVTRLYQLLREVAYRALRDPDREAVIAQRARLDDSVAGVDYDEVERSRFSAMSAAVDAAAAGRWD
ncbi:MAG: DUF2254 domain-containing protein [Pseudolysinimonas sp.]|uniref:DUF2254 domain-containing protein n=1 Tax=Pseudolysinimonas sp. TaxID=2680009 RepID=UPI0032678C22